VNDSSVIRLCIKNEQSGLRADKALAVLCLELYEQSKDEAVSLSRSRIQALMEAGCIECNGEKLKDSSRAAKEGEEYKITLPPAEKAAPEPENIPLDIIYEDEYVIVLNKPIGMVVHPGAGNKGGTLVNALLAHCGEDLSGIGGEIRPGIVHRLDKDTSGLMIIAKNDFAHRKLAEQFENRSLSRTYWAVVWGVPELRAGEIELSVGRSARDRKKIAIRSDGKRAVTRYRVLEDFGVASLIECKLLTGRTHQIRVHMAHKGHPIVGDTVYGGRTARKGEELLTKFPRQALHAIKLEFLHPKDGKMKRFKTVVPKDMEKLLVKLKSGK